MAERKVISKYYPPDFDPSKVVRVRKKKGAGRGPPQQKVRMMMPMSLTCNTCGEYIYQGKKFNSRKETVEGETYLGIKIFRFYQKCPRCAAEFTIRTDPKNADYAVEKGCRRQSEPWKQEAAKKAAAEGARESEEAGDAMKVLENQTAEAQREESILDALEEIKAQNARQVTLTPAVMQELRKREDEQLAEEDERLIRERFGGGIKRLNGEHEVVVEPEVVVVEDKQERAKKKRRTLVVAKKTKKKEETQVRKETPSPVDALSFLSNY